MTEKTSKKRYFRLMYGRTLRYFGSALPLCAIVGALYGDRLRFVFALCAAGGAFLCWGWFTYLCFTGWRLFGLDRTPGAKHVPFFHRREKKRIRPSFAMKEEDFDDDLSHAITLREEELDEYHRVRARWLARAFCGALLIAVSFFIRL